MKGINRVNNAFTLIEIIMVILIIGILATIVIPKFASLAEDSRVASTKGALGGIRAAIYTEAARNETSGTLSFPATISGSLFADGRVPKNELVDSTVVNSVADTVNGSTTSNMYGWWYVTSGANRGRISAYVTGSTLNSSDW